MTCRDPYHEGHELLAMALYRKSPDCQNTGCKNGINPSFRQNITEFFFRILYNMWGCTISSEIAREHRHSSGKQARQLVFHLNSHVNLHRLQKQQLYPFSFYPVLLMRALGTIRASTVWSCVMEFPNS